MPFDESILPVEICSHIEVFLEKDDIGVVGKGFEGSIHHCLVVASDAQCDVGSPSIITLKLHGERLLYLNISLQLNLLS